MSSIFGRINTKIAQLRTVDATFVPIFEFVLGPEDAIAIEVLAVAKEPSGGGGGRSGFHRRAMVYRTGGGGATRQGTVQSSFTRMSPAASADIDLDGDASTKARVLITSGAAETWDWEVVVNWARAIRT